MGGINAYMPRPPLPSLPGGVASVQAETCGLTVLVLEDSSSACQNSWQWAGTGVNAAQSLTWPRMAQAGELPGEWEALLEGRGPFFAAAEAELRVRVLPHLWV